ncbi:MAG: glycosyltransferase [Neomegalonema sp.]|nr:glycosyltransferase [Neomegalonema sp.]
MKIRKHSAQLIALYAKGFARLGWRGMSAQTRRLAVAVSPQDTHRLLDLARAQRQFAFREEALATLMRAQEALKRRERAAGFEEPALLGAAMDPARGDQGPVISGIAREWASLARTYLEFSKPELAIACYQRGLHLAPHLADLWDQYGHLLRARDQFEEALQAQEAAYRLHHRDYGRRHKIGELLKILNREVDALEIHHDHEPWTQLRAAEQRPDLPAALVRAGASLQAAASEQGADIVIDLSDLVHFLRVRRFFSGIQRVQAEIALGIMDNPGPHRIHIAMFNDVDAKWELKDPQALRALISEAQQRAGHGPKRLRAPADAVLRSSGGDFAALKAPILFVPGATWSAWRLPLAIKAAKRRQGLRYVPFVHDCIPLIVPDTCSADMPNMYGRWLAASATVADAFLVNSENTGRDLARFLSEGSGREEAALPPIKATPLNARTSLGGASVKPRLHARVDSVLSARGFALTVGSIEPRKRHIDIFRAWEILIGKHGDKAPVLVLVGRAGWREEEAVNYLDNSPSLKGSVFWLTDLSDEELAWCYENAQFSVMASEYEGWGMPVTESLNAGLPALVARNSALVEAGSEAVRYFETRDPASLAQAVEALAMDRQALAQAKAQCAVARLRDWQDLADDTLSLLNTVARQPLSPERAAPLLMVGTSADFGARSYGPDLCVQEGVMHGPAWAARNPGALWTVGGGEAILAFRLAAGQGPARLVLELRAGADDLAFSPQISVDEGDFDALEPVTLRAGQRRTWETVLPASTRPGEVIFQLRLRSDARFAARAIGIERMSILPA